MKTILYICEEWPNPYKPTWDAQISCLIRHGLRVLVVHCGEHPSRQHEDWRESGAPLGSVRRFTYPSTLKDVPRHLRNPGFLLRIASRITHVRHILRQRKPLKEKLLDYLRLCALPTTRSDFLLVKNLNCATDFSWLPATLKSTPSAVYYHGGAVVGVDPWYLKHRDLVFKSFQSFFTNTGYSKRELEALGCLPVKIHVVPVGLDIGAHRHPLKVYREGGILRILSACRLSKEKGVAYAVRAVEKLVKEGITNLKLDVLGNGLEEDELRAYVRNHGIGRWIEFHGHQPNELVVGKYLKSSDVFLNTCFPTPTWVETQCIAIQEAGLARVPSIASNCGGLPEVIINGETGLLTQPQSVDSIAAAIKAMALMDPLDIARMGESAEKFARSNFDVEFVTSRLLSLMAKSEETADNTGNTKPETDGEPVQQATQHH